MYHNFVEEFSCLRSFGKLVPEYKILLRIFKKINVFVR